MGMGKEFVIVIIEWLLFAIINVVFISYLAIFFKKKNITIKYYNKNFIIIIFSLLLSTIVPLSLGTVGVTIGWPKAAVIVLFLTGFSLLLAVCGIIFFLLQYIAIGFTSTDIEFLGEKIPLEKVYKTQLVKEKNKFYIHYYESKRGQKKYGFKLTSPAFDFIKENEHLIEEKMLKSNTELKSTEAK